MSLRRILLTLGIAVLLVVPASAQGTEIGTQVGAKRATVPGKLVSVLERGQSVDTVAVASKYAFAGGLFGMGIFDMKRPARPRLAASTNGWIRDVAIRGNYAYVQNSGGDESTVVVVDIDGPVTAVAWINPPRVPNVPPSTFAPQLSFSGPILVRGSRLYAAYEDYYNPWLIYQGLAVYSIRDPHNPQLLGRVRLHNSTSVNRLAASGSYVYVGGLTGLETVNVANPSNPRRTAFRKTSSRGLAVNGRYLFSGIPVNDGTVAVYSLAKPARPKYRGKIWGPADLVATDDLQVTRRGKRSYLLVAWNTTPADFEWVHVYDITPPLKLGKKSLLRDRGKLRGVTQNRVNDIAVDGNVVYVAQGYAGVRVVKVNFAALARSR